MNFIKLEPEPDGESYLSSFHNENQENDVAQDENLKHVGCPIMKTENDVIMDFIKSEPNSDCETCLKFSHSENEMVDVKEEEDPILITFPVVKPENEAVKSCDELEGTAEAQATVTGEQGQCHATPKEYESHGQNPAVCDSSCLMVKSLNTHNCIYSCNVCKKTELGNIWLNIAENACTHMISARKPLISLVALKSICIYIVDGVCTLVICVGRRLGNILNFSFF